MVSVKLRPEEAEEVRQLAKLLVVTQAEIMRMGLAAARRKAARRARAATG